jgi:uncharacterized protein YkwD
MRTAILALLAILTFTGATAYYPLNIRQPHAPIVLEEEQRALMADVNAARAEHGLAPLSADGRLARAALGHARDMAAHNYFAHDGGGDGTLADRLRAVHFDWTIEAENIALNSDETHANIALLQSPGHRANILDPQVRYIGVAALSIGAGSTLYVEDFAR